MTSKPWRVLARRILYASDWMDLQQVDIQLPDGKILRDVHLVDYKHAAAGVVPMGDDGRVLLIDHYRFQTDTRGWEIPAGRIDAGESPEQAIARELAEETGHRASTFKELGHYFRRMARAIKRFTFLSRAASHARAKSKTRMR